MINICSHPIHGRCFLWEMNLMNYRIGTVATNYMKFDGYTLDEVMDKITKKGFVVLPWSDVENI
jgi:hypothetical protein